MLYIRSRSRPLAAMGAYIETSHLLIYNGKESCFKPCRGGMRYEAKAGCCGFLAQSDACEYRSSVVGSGIGNMTSIKSSLVLLVAVSALSLGAASGKACSHRFCPFSCGHLGFAKSVTSFADRKRAPFPGTPPESVPRIWANYTTRRSVVTARRRRRKRS